MNDRLHVKFFIYLTLVFDLKNFVVEACQKEINKLTSVKNVQNKTNLMS